MAATAVHNVGQCCLQYYQYASLIAPDVIDKCFVIALDFDSRIAETIQSKAERRFAQHLYR